MNNFINIRRRGINREGRKGKFKRKQHKKLTLFFQPLPANQDSGDKK